MLIIYILNIFNKIGSIEVLNEKSQIQRIFFKIPRSILRVWHLDILLDLRTKVINSVKRDNPEDKVKSLFDSFELIDQMIDYQNNIFRFLNFFLPNKARDLVFYKLKDSQRNLLRIFILVCLLQNAFQVYYTETPTTQFYYQEHDELEWLEAFFHITGLISLLLICYITFISFLDTVM